MNQKRAFIIFVPVALTIATAAFFGLQKVFFAVNLPLNSDMRIILIEGGDLKVDVADTVEERARGLGGREKLDSDEGMLFVFEADGEYGFWMMDMNFPIDILWISSSERIVDMRKNVSPASYPEVFTPRAPARYVLELPAGFSREHNLDIGDLLEL